MQQNYALHTRNSQRWMDDCRRQECANDCAALSYNCSAGEKKGGQNQRKLFARGREAPEETRLTLKLR